MWSGSSKNPLILRFWFLDSWDCMKNLGHILYQLKMHFDWIKKHECYWATWPKTEVYFANHEKCMHTSSYTCTWVYGWCSHNSNTGSYNELGCPHTPSLKYFFSLSLSHMWLHKCTYNGRQDFKKCSHSNHNENYYELRHMFIYTQQIVLFQFLLVVLMILHKCVHYVNIISKSVDMWPTTHEFIVNP